MTISDARLTEIRAAAQAEVDQWGDRCQSLAIRFAEVVAMIDEIRAVRRRLGGASLVSDERHGPGLCDKHPHARIRGLLHGADDDGPYDVDGVAYCGRCHRAIGRTA